MIKFLLKNCTDRAVARTLIYSGYARLTSFQINFISKETSRAEPEYMNIHPPPPINVLEMALCTEITLYLQKTSLCMPIDYTEWI